MNLLGRLIRKCTKTRNALLRAQVTRLRKKNARLRAACVDVVRIVDGPDWLRGVFAEQGPGEKCRRAAGLTHDHFWLGTTYGLVLENFSVLTPQDTKLVKLAAFILSSHIERELQRPWRFLQSARAYAHEALREAEPGKPGECRALRID